MSKRSVQTALDRIDLYLSRVKRDLDADERAEALSNVAELAEITRRLWIYLADQEGMSCVEAQLKLAGEARTRMPRGTSPRRRCGAFWLLARVG